MQPAGIRRSPPLALPERMIHQLYISFRVGILCWGWPASRLAGSGDSVVCAVCQITVEARAMRSCCDEYVEVVRFQ
jgi:hypothetical protein